MYVYVHVQCLKAITYVATSSEFQRKAPAESKEGYLFWTLGTYHKWVLTLHFDSAPIIDTYCTRSSRGISGGYINMAREYCLRGLPYWCYQPSKIGVCCLENEFTETDAQQHKLHSMRFDFFCNYDCIRIQTYIRTSA